jgi:hypothetical protein
MLLQDECNLNFGYWSFINDRATDQPSTDWAQLNWSYSSAAQFFEGFDDQDYQDCEYAGISTPNPFDFEWEMMFKIETAPPFLQPENDGDFATPAQGGQDFGWPDQSDAIEHNDTIFQMPEYLSYVS